MQMKPSPCMGWVMIFFILFQSTSRSATFKTLKFIFPFIKLVHLKLRQVKALKWLRLSGFWQRTAVHFLQLFFFSLLFLLAWHPKKLPFPSRLCKTVGSNMSASSRCRIKNVQASCDKLVKNPAYRETLNISAYAYWGKYQNCHIVLKGSFWFYSVLILVLFSSVFGSLVFFSVFILVL